MKIKVLKSGMRTNKRVSAIVIKKDKILLIHRRRNGDEYWVVPGGGVESEETIEQGLLREVKEETSLNVKDYKLVETIGEYVDFHGMHQTVKHYFYLCEIENGEPVLGGPEAKSHSEQDWYHLEWVDLNSIHGLDLYPAHTKAVVKTIRVDLT